MIRRLGCGGMRLGIVLYEMGEREDGCRGFAGSGWEGDRGGREGRSWRDGLVDGGRCKVGRETGDLGRERARERATH